MSLYTQDINKFAIFPAVPIVLNGQNCPVHRHFVFIEGFERKD